MVTLLKYLVMSLFLPTYSLLCFQIMLHFLAIMVVAGAANVYIFIPVAVVIVLLLALRWYYLKTSREIKRLEAIGVLSVQLYAVRCQPLLTILPSPSPPPPSS